ncbi:MAG: MBL fold metallo-hydrolase, partial [Bacteroidota bacterium]
MRIAERTEWGAVSLFKLGYWPFGPPPMTVYCFLVDGLLVDTGQTRCGDLLLSQLQATPPSQVFLSHHHEDHVSNASRIQERFNCLIKTVTHCAELLQSPPSISPARWLTWGPYGTVPPLEIVKDEVRTPSYRFQIIPIPGHSSDMVGLYEPEQGWFFSADLFVSPYIRYFKNDEQMGEQIASLKRVLTLDFEVLFCCHNPQRQNGK